MINITLIRLHYRALFLSIHFTFPWINALEVSSDLFEK